jgi:hypothetical protein
MTDTQLLALIFSVLAWLFDHVWHLLFLLWALFVGLCLYSIAVQLTEIRNLMFTQNVKQEQKEAKERYYQKE